jgi:hypothetical protein
MINADSRKYSVVRLAGTADEPADADVGVDMGETCGPFFLPIGERAASPDNTMARYVV